MSSALKYSRNQVRPETWLWIYDDDGALMNFGSGTFRTRIGHRGSAALKEKTTGFTGAAGSGNEQTAGSVPNLKIAWITGDLDITGGEYELQIEWNIGSNTPRYWYRDLIIDDIILAP